MTRNFSDSDIYKFTKEARTMTTTELSYMQALHKIAQREGFKDWGSLKKCAIQTGYPSAKKEEGLEPNPLISCAELLRLMIQRIEVASNAEIDRLFNGGTIWIDPLEIKNNTVDQYSFVFLDSLRYGFASQYSRGLVLIADMDGLAETSVLETRIHDEEDASQYKDYDVLTVEQGKKMILEGIEMDIQNFYEDILNMELFDSEAS